MRISRHAVDAALAPSEWITGDARIETLAVSPGPHAAIATVTFAPGARTVWHRHRLGQTLIVTAGTGRVARRGGAVETIWTGDTVHIDPGEWHWHGAAPTLAMTHLAIEQIPDDGPNAEAGPSVTDSEYCRDDTGEPSEPAPVIRTMVLDQTLPAPRSTSRVEVRRITIAPEHPGGLHVHNGPVFGSIETGSAVYQIEGGAAVVLGPGDVFYEPEGVRIARFDARHLGVTFLGYFLLDVGETPEIQFPGE